MRPENSEWGAGPWDSEPDRVEFEYEGFPCLVRRSPSTGALCGYVAVSPGHPLHGEGDIAAPPLEVHGGVTYAGPCEGDICHVPKPGQPDNVWWFGFDCGHSGDVIPIMAKWLEEHRILRSRRSTYRDIAYVQAECRELADQLKEIAIVGLPGARPAAG